MSGLVILVTYYTATQDPDTAFEKFMDGQAFGVRILFTAFGVLLTFCWDRYYTRKSLSLTLELDDTVRRNILTTQYPDMSCHPPLP